MILCSRNIVVSLCLATSVGGWDTSPLGWGRGHFVTFSHLLASIMVSIKRLKVPEWEDTQEAPTPSEEKGRG